MFPVIFSTFLSILGLLLTLKCVPLLTGALWPSCCQLHAPARQQQRSVRHLDLLAISHSYGMLWENRHSLEGTSAKSSKKWTIFHLAIFNYQTIREGQTMSSYMVYGFWSSIPYHGNQNIMGYQNPYQWIMTGLMTIPRMGYTPTLDTDWIDDHRGLLETPPTVNMAHMPQPMVDDMRRSEVFGLVWLVQMGSWKVRWPPWSFLMAAWAGLAEGVLGLQYFRSGLEPKNLGPAWWNIVMLVLVGLGPCKQEFKLRHLNSQLAKCMSDFGKAAMCCWGCVVAKRVCVCLCVCVKVWAAQIAQTKIYVLHSDNQCACTVCMYIYTHTALLDV